MSATDSRSKLVERHVDQWVLVIRSHSRLLEPGSLGGFLRSHIKAAVIVGLHIQLLGFTIAVRAPVACPPILLRKPGGPPTSGHIARGLSLQPSRADLVEEGGNGRLFSDEQGQVRKPRGFN